MDCSEVRRILWPADSPRLSDEEVEGALNHAQECAACGHFLTADRRVAQLVRDSVPRVTAPRELRERLYTALARERTGALSARKRTPLMRRGLGAAAILVGAAAVGLTAHLLARGGAESAGASAFAEDYLRRVVAQEELLSTDRDQIAEFFARELGLAMAPPDVPQFERTRAMICLLNGRRGGVVEYASGQLRFSHYLLPLDEKQPMQPARLRSGTVANQPGFPTSLTQQRGLGVATWRDGKHQHALVGNLSAQELEKLARMFVCPTSSL